MKGNFIGGEWVGSASGRTRERRNPADEREVVAVFPDSDAKDAHDAVSAVAAGYREWAERGPEPRAAVLHRAADILAARADDLARELVREEGKTLAEALTETRRTPSNLRFYAGEALRVAGRTYATGDGSLVYTSREPVGVVVAITPWNFPLNIPSRKLGPALAAGNGVVFKPSEVTPLLGQRLVEALIEASVPAGALALVQGGGEAGAALVADPRVGAVTFTGSSDVGAAIHRAVGPSQRCQLEMGGKNPVIVLEDADLDRAADIVVRGAFGLSGQACTGTSRLIVHDAVHDALVQRVVALARARRVGYGLSDGVQMGPLATRAQLEKTRHYLDLAAVADARLRAGDEPLGPGLEHGNFVRPAVFTDVDPSSPLAQEEIFGPVLSVLRVDSFDDAISVANDTAYGLSAGIVTRDLGRALEFARRVDSGLVKVNQPTTGMAMNAPFGGLKNSSTQTFKEQAGETMMHFYTVDKTVYVGS
ncbi:aldehyde dehydrogenase family protein [Micromonospora sp. NBC_00898]|uniref:aldehyde dehydrogenase family protein n=1 Tax=Micromonospora sp. NBC_00898 TaxID=2975981 RepID=UPI0038699273|nr:aldehyde dehydrogenase family protein [Micromonospora sp. NBC_00898]